MKRSAWLFVAVLVALVGWGAGCAHHQMTAPGGERTDLLYVCDCGPQCKCNTVSKTPGKCACGATDLKETHVVKVEGDEALLCTCGGGCTCDLDPNDPTKCGCGKAIKRVSLKNSGLYFCNCGGECKCNVIADRPGQCKCGMPLKKSDG